MNSNNQPSRSERYQSRNAEAEQIEVIEDVEVAKSKTTIPLKKHLAKFISNKSVAVPLDIINNFMSFLIIIHYVYLSNYPEQSGGNYFFYVKEEDLQAHKAKEDQYGVYIYTIYPNLLLFIHFYFLLEYLVRLYCAKNFMTYFLSRDSTIELLAGLPFLIVTLAIQDNSNFFAYFVRMMDVLRVLSLFRLSGYIENDIYRELANIVIGVLGLVICFTSYIQLVENYMFKREVSPENFGRCLAETNLYKQCPDPGDYQYIFESFFLVMTTISIIGFNSPAVSQPGQISLIFLMGIVIVVVPNQSSKLISLISSKSVYARRTYKSIDKISHIVLMGSISDTAFLNFLEEYFHKDHGEENRHCVIIKPTKPDPNIVMEVHQPKYQQGVYFIEGNPLEQRDLKRCLVEKAKAIIILSDKLSFDAQKEDTHTILQAMVIKNYLNARKDTKQETQICMQLLKPESITHYELSLNKEDIKNDQIVCIESMKLSLLAKSCLCPGLVALITNLIKSSKSPPKGFEEQRMEQEDMSELRWLHEYWQGKKYEIYRIEIPDSKADQAFCNIANDVYKEYSLILFALEIVVEGRQNGEILLNPGDYRLPKPQSSSMQYKYFGYIIAPDKSDAEKIFKDSLKDKKLVRFQKAKKDSLNSRLEQNNHFNQGILAEKNPDDDDGDMMHGEAADGDWMTMCHMALKPVDKQDITMPTLKDSKLAENHIIICGMVENIRHFVMPLRASHLKEPSPIVILNDEPLTSKQWQQLSFFTQIYFVLGSPLNETSYDRVNIKKAKQVVILYKIISPSTGNKNEKEEQSQQNESQDAKQDSSKISQDQENLLDAQTIFKYNIIKKKNPNVNVVTELISQNNIAFLLDDPLLFNLLRLADYDQTPTFASGEVYLSSLMDSLICQAYYNPALTIVLRQLIIGDSKSSKRRGLKRQINGDGDFSNVKTSNLYHVQVPPNYVGKKYKKLFDYLTTRKYMIPLGLYRTEKVCYSKFKMEDDKKKKIELGNNYSHKENTIKYVVTNPNKEKVILRESDLVFVLAQNDPGDPKTWEDFSHYPEDELEFEKKQKLAGKDMDKQNNYQGLDESVEQNKVDPNQGSKQDKINFDRKVEELNAKIRKIKQEVVTISKVVNKRNSQLVKNIAQAISDLTEQIDQVQPGNY